MIITITASMDGKIDIKGGRRVPPPSEQVQQQKVPKPKKKRTLDKKQGGAADISLLSRMNVFLGLLLYSPSLACGSYDCDNNGIPDDWKEM